MLLLPFYDAYSCLFAEWNSPRELLFRLEYEDQSGEVYNLEVHKVIVISILASGRFEWNFRYVIFKRILVTDGWGISCEIVLIQMSLDFTNDQSTLV